MENVEVLRQDEESLARQAKSVPMSSLYRVHYNSHRRIFYWSCSRCRAERELFRDMGIEIIRES